MRMDHVDSFGLNEPRQSKRTAPIESGFATEPNHPKPFALQLLAQMSDVVEAGENESERSMEPSRQSSGQHFGAAHTKAVQDLANCGNSACHHQLVCLTKD